MNSALLLEHYARIADAPDAIARLRRFVLDLAVRGKLVNQNAADEPASELLKRIAANNAGRRKASEQLALDEAQKFAVPSGWELVPLGNVVAHHLGGGTPSKTVSAYWDGNICWASVKDVGKSKYLDDTIDRITPEGLVNSSSNLIEPGHLIVVTRMGLGKVSINRTEVAINQDLRALKFGHGVDLEYAYNFFLTHAFEGTGLTVKGIKLAELLHFPFPLPPFAEQKRIVAKVEELMRLCDQLEAARAEREAGRDRLTAATLARLNAPHLETFPADARFALDNLTPLTTRPDQIKQLRQTILNLAVRGKLVEQVTSDCSVTNELQGIKSERDAMVQAKIIRREKPLEAVSEEQKPFDIPSNWIWSRIGDVALFTQYGTSEKSEPRPNGVPVLTMGNIQDGCIIWSNEKRIPASSEELPNLYLKKFDVLYNRTNSADLVGKTGIYLGENDCRTFASYLIRIRFSAVYSLPSYFNLAMNAPIFRETQIKPLIKQQTGQANVNGTALKNMLIPVPPLAEQHRIVSKVGELTGVCDQIEASLKEGEQVRFRLLESVLHNALEPA